MLCEDVNLIGYLNSPASYADAIAERSKMRGWGFTTASLNGLRALLKNATHEYPSGLLGLDMWIGHGVHWNAFEALEFLGKQLNDLDIGFFLDKEIVRAIGEYEKSNVRQRRLDIVYIDSRLKHPNRYIRRDERLPSCLSLWFLALNPRLCKLADFDGIHLIIDDPMSGIKAPEITLRFDEELDRVYLNQIKFD